MHIVADQLAFAVPQLLLLGRLVLDPLLLFLEVRLLLQQMRSVLFGLL